MKKTPKSQQLTNSAPRMKICFVLLVNEVWIAICYWIMQLRNNLLGKAAFQESTNIINLP